MPYLFFVKWLWFTYKMIRKYKKPIRKIAVMARDDIDKMKTSNGEKLTSAQKRTQFAKHVKKKIDHELEKQLGVKVGISKVGIAQLREDVWEMKKENFTKKNKRKGKSI